MKHEHDVVIKVPQVDALTYEFERIKKHVKSNKSAYLCLAVGVVIGRSMHKEEPPTIVVRFETPN